MKVRYLGTAPGQASRCSINAAIGRTSAGEKVWSGDRRYELRQEYLVSEELGEALLKLGGFEVVIEAEPPKRGRKEA